MVISVKIDLSVLLYIYAYTSTCNKTRDKSLNTHIDISKCRIYKIRHIHQCKQRYRLPLEEAEGSVVLIKVAIDVFLIGVF